MYAGNPILDEIKIGFKLRPTKTVDKSKPVFIAEGESTDEISPKKRGGPVASSSTDDAPVRSTATTSKWSPKPSSDNSPVAAVTVVPGVVPPPPPPPPCFGGAPPPPPPPPPLGGAPPPPPPPMGSAPPPPPVVRKAITNPALLKLGGKPSGDVDKNELLKSIQGGFKLKKTVTNDKSGLVVDDELKSSSVKMVTPTAPPPSLLAPPKGSGRSQLSPAGSDDERYLTADDRSASCTPEPEEKPRQFKWSCPSERKDVKKSDFVFEEKNLLVSADDLKQEIPTGLAASKIAKWLAAENVDGAATLPRPSFRASPSPLRGNSPFKEMNNNNTMDTLKPKAPSKWAVVETGGLRRPGQGNVPLDKSRETTPQPMRERSCSALEKPYGREQTDRAKTASPERRRASHVETPLSIKTDFPSPTSSAASKVSPSSTAASKPSPATSRSSALSPAASKPSPASSTASKPSPASAASKLASPLSIQTDFSSIAPAKKSSAKKTTTATKKKTSTAKQPEIKETPPTPSAKTNGTSYSYKRTERPASPPEPAVSMPSPVSSMSTASVPSPSSISPGSSSPDTGPRRRAVNANFDKVKEKFANSATVTPSPPPSRPFLKTGGTSVRDSPFHSKTNTPSPRGSVSSTKDEAAAVKKAVKEAAAGKQKQRVINVPINAPWHTPRESYSTGDYSPRDFSRDYGSLDYSSRNYSRDYSSPDFSPRDYTRSYDYSPRSETNWRSSRDPTTPTRTRYDVDSYKFSSMHPDDLRRNYRFNIDVSSDAPLSLSRR